MMWYTCLVNSLCSNIRLLYCVYADVKWEIRKTQLNCFLTRVSSTLIRTVSPIRYLFVPYLCRSVHWALVVVDKWSKQVLCYDSICTYRSSEAIAKLRGVHGRIMRIYRNWIHGLFMKIEVHNRAVFMIMESAFVTFRSMFGWAHRR